MVSLLTINIKHSLFIEQNGHAAHRRRSNVSQMGENDRQKLPFEEKRKSTVNGSILEDRKNALADLLEISFSRKSWNFRAERA